LLIKNYDELLSKDLGEKEKILRKIGLEALEEGLEAVRPSNLIKNSIKVEDGTLIVENNAYDLKKYKNIYFIGGGKATKEMAKILEEILIQDSVEIKYEGIINIPEKQRKNEKFKPNKITINYATHPIPNENGVEGVKKMMNLIENSNPDDLFVCLISGGGSALLPLPKSELSLDDLKRVNNLLLSSGASIHEINTIRKHLSNFKGGNLAKKIYESSNATLISLIISDVVGDNLDAIASGPTVPDFTTFEDAIKIIYKYNLYNEIPVPARQIIERGLKDPSLETPKPNDDCFTNIHNYLIGSVKSAAKRAITFLKEKKYETNYFSNTISGEASEYGKVLFEIIKYNMKNKEQEANLSDKIALIGTGELTVTIRGQGKGGRNQEMLLSFLDHVKNKSIDTYFLIISVNLDGIEGNSRAMGALIDNHVLRITKKEKIDTGEYLYNNDSNSFFQKVSSEIITGPTGINVNDLIISLLWND
jgi:glycerate 2-kinase